MNRSAKGLGWVIPGVHKGIPIEFSILRLPHSSYPLSATPVFKVLFMRNHAAHLFIFYFGCISNVTPPVSLASYAAAGIADAPAFRTAVTALLLAATGFVIPFAFVFAPALLLDDTLGAIAVAGLMATSGVVALAAAAAGHHNRRLPAIERLLLLAAAVAMLSPNLVLRIVGAVVLASSLLWQRFRST